MKTKLKSKTSWPLILALLLKTVIFAQEEKGKTKFVENEVIINDSPQKVWKALSAYGNVSYVNATIDDSVMLNGTNEEAHLGAEREVQIPNGVNNIINKERIINYIEGVYYTFEVYESENFPTKKMQVTYGVRQDFKGRTILFSKTYYELNNGLVTNIFKRKMKRANMDSLLAYKNYIETGEANAEIKSLRKMYDNEDEEPGNGMIVTNVLAN